MILNTNTINSLQDGQGEGHYITPEIVLCRRRIVEDANDWFNTKDPYFVEVCQNANMSPYWVCRIFKKIKSANVKKLFKFKNLNKFLLEYICKFENEK